jgi:hypothetical protein
MYLICHHYRGEILVKSNTMAQGYYKDPEATSAAFTDDGWFRTVRVASSSAHQKDGATHRHIIAMMLTCIDDICAGRHRRDGRRAHYGDRPQEEHLQTSAR